MLSQFKEGVCRGGVGLSCSCENLEFLCSEYTISNFFVKKMFCWYKSVKAKLLIFFHS